MKHIPGNVIKTKQRGLTKLKSVLQINNTTIPTTGFVMRFLHVSCFYSTRYFETVASLFTKSKELTFMQYSSIPTSDAPFAQSYE